MEPTLLERLVESVAGAQLIPDEGALADRQPPREGASWQEVLERACAPYPLRLRPLYLSLREAVGAARARTPLVGHLKGVGWVVLFDRSRSRLRVRAIAGGGEERWIRLGDLPGELGLDSVEGVLPWILVEPTRPARPAESAHYGASHLAPLRRLMGLVKPDGPDLWAIVLYAVFIGGLTLATPIAVQQLVNSVAFGGLLQPVVIVALLLFGGLAFSALLTVLQAYVAEAIQRRVFVRVAIDLADRLPRVSADALDRKHGPELVNRIFDVFTVQKTGASLLLDGTAVVLQTVVGLIVLSFYHPLMLGFSALLLVGIVLVAVVLGRNAVDTAIGESNAKYAMVGWMEELARHPGIFRHPEGRRYAVERADRLAVAWIGARRNHFRRVLRQLSGALGLQVLAGSALLALGGALVVAGQLTLGQLVASELIITAIVAAVARLGKQLESYYDLLAAVDKLGVLFDLPLEQDGGSESVEGSGPVSVELRDVRFGFEGESLIEDLSFAIGPGERLLVEGPAGAGKSTLLDLLLGLRAPSAGFIALDGHDLRDLSLRELRRQVLCVREPEIFPGSVLDNVRVARPWLPRGRVMQALEELGVIDSVRRMPEGLDTPLSASGAPLSDSQVAALMLARATVTEPRLLLLDDDALMRLERSTREIALDAVLAPKAPWTVVVVSELPEVRARCTKRLDIRTGAVSTLAGGAASPP